MDETKIYPNIEEIFERVTSDRTKGLFVSFANGIACLATKQNLSAYQQCFGAERFYKAKSFDKYVDIPDDDVIKTFLRAIVDLWVNEDDSDIVGNNVSIAVGRRLF